MMVIEIFVAKCPPNCYLVNKSLLRMGNYMNIYLVKANVRFYFEPHSDTLNCTLKIFRMEGK